MPRIKEVLAEKNISLSKLGMSLSTPIDRRIMSQMANYKFNPTPKVLDEVCLILGCVASDLYDYEELDCSKHFLSHHEPKNSVMTISKFYNPSHKIQNPYKLTVPIEKKDRDLLFNKDVLNRYGVRSITEFVRIIIKEKIEEVKENG